MTNLKPNMGNVFRIYAIKDELTNSFMQPIFVKTDDEMKRIFIHQINTIGLWKDNPQDYTLFCLGEFHEDTGSIFPLKDMIASGKSVIKEGDKNDI